MRTVRFIAPKLITGAILAATVLSLSLFAGKPAIAEAGNGVITGQLANGTSGGGSVAGQTVQLHTLQNAQEVSGPANSATADSSGKFEFKGLATTSDYSYYVSLTYQKADYQSDPVAFASGEVSKPMQVTVYDSTTQDPGIKATEAYTLLVPHQADAFLVTEYFNIANDSDHAYIGSEPVASTGRNKTLSFPLPQGVGTVGYSTGLQDGYAIQDSQGITDTMAVIPPGREIAFQYVVPSGTSYSFSETFTTAVDTFYVAIPGDSVKFDGSGLSEHGPVQMPIGSDPNAAPATFSLFTASNITAGQQITGTFSNIAKPVAQAGHGFLWALIALGVVVLGAAVAYPLWRRRKELAFEGTGAPVASGNRSDELEDQLLKEIAELDDAFERGDLEENEYHKKRLDKKQQLASLMQRRDKR